MGYKGHSPDFDIHELEWFGEFSEGIDNDDGNSMYTLMDITEDNFAFEKRLSLYLMKTLDSADFPEDTALIKFSYYSEHDTPILIEEENVTVIQDGKVGDDAVSVTASISQYQFVCDNSHIPFDDEAEVKLTARQGSERLIIKDISVTSEQTTFVSDMFTLKVDGLMTQDVSVTFGIKNTGKAAPERMTAVIKVTCEDIHEEEVERELYFESICVSTGAYLGAFHIITSDYLSTESGSKIVLKKDWHVGDYFLKLEDTTGESLEAITGLRYKWTGNEWVEDKDESHMMSSFGDMISYAEELQSNADTVKVFKSLTTAMLEVGKMFANQITLMNNDNKYGLIKSEDYDSENIAEDQTIKTLGNGKSGWAIDGKGQAEFNNMYSNGGNFENANVKGKISCNVLDFNNIKGGDVLFSRIFNSKLMIKKYTSPAGISGNIYILIGKQIKILGNGTLTYKADTYLGYYQYYKFSSIKNVTFYITRTKIDELDKELISQIIFEEKLIKSDKKNFFQLKEDVSVDISFEKNDVISFFMFCDTGFNGISADVDTSLINVQVNQTPIIEGLYGEASNVLLKEISPTSDNNYLHELDLKAIGLLNSYAIG